MTDSPQPPRRPLSGIVGRLDRWLSPIENATNFVAATFIFLLMLLGVAQVTLRTIFEIPISGYIDLVELSMAGMAFLGAAYTQRLGGHVRMELVIGNLKGRAYWMAEIIGLIVGMAIIAILTWYSAEHFLRSYQLGDTSIDAEFPVWPSKLLVPIAFGLWFVRLLIQLAGSIRLLLDPGLSPEGVVLVKDAAETAREEAHDALSAPTTKEA